MKYQVEVRALLKKADRSLRVAKGMIGSQDYDFSLSRDFGRGRREITMW
jgi:hypothetical protein